jgi:hypothetical protein
VWPGVIVTMISLENGRRAASGSHTLQTGEASGGVVCVRPQRTARVGDEDDGQREDDEASTRRHRFLLLAMGGSGQIVRVSSRGRPHRAAIRGHAMMAPS